MKLILNPCTDPAFNLAAEEYLLSTTREPLCMLWRNGRAVIVGRNQDALAEIDSGYADEQGIPVYRRITGGGAVYHDLGNVNYTLIEPEGHFNDYAYFTADLIAFLASLGVKAELSGRNDLLVGNLKICGNAQCAKNGMVLHHGCVLYDSDLSVLARVLRPGRAKLEGKGIASVASRVTNIREYIGLDTAAFLHAFADYMKMKHSCAEYHFTGDDKASIRRLADEKYSAREWNFGCSPDWEGKLSPQ